MAYAVDERLPFGKLATLGLQHVLVMYAGAIAVPLIVGKALQLSSEQVALLISADLFVCGIVTLIQSWGMTQWFGIKLPVMMGVTFAAVGPMVAMAKNTPGVAGAQLIFGAIIGSGIIAIIIAPFISRLLRFFPPLVTGTIITVIGISLMRIGINWIFGNPVGPTAPTVINPEHTQWLEATKALAGNTLPPTPNGLALTPSVPNPLYASPLNIGISMLVLMAILVISKFAKGFFANIAVLLGILVGALVTTALGLMHFDKVQNAPWFALIQPLQFGIPVFDIWLILTMTLVMIVVMIESTGMFLALGEMTGKPVDQPALARGLRTDGLGTLIGGLFNTFPYTSFSQNVGLVAITGIKSRFVCVMAGIILIILGLIPKMGALVEALPLAVLGGAGLVMFGMVAVTGIRILATVDFTQRQNALVVAVSIGIGMIPLVAPQFKQWLPHNIHPLIESGIILASISAVLLNLLFNGTKTPSNTSLAAQQVSE